MKLWEGQDEDISELEFDEILADMKKKGITIYDKKNRPCIQVDDNASTLTKTMKEVELEGPKAGRKRRREPDPSPTTSVAEDDDDGVGDAS
eukprot:4317901-Pyramimonas_sp.AAC.1